MVVKANETSSRVNLDDMMASITQAYPEHALAGWELFDDKSRSDTAYVIKKGTETWFKIYIDQYSGELLRL